MTLNQLEYFLTVAQYSSMTKAANKLYVTHSAISRNISDLENEFKVALFTRENHKLLLTEAGQLLVQHCRKVLDAVEELKAAMQWNSFNQATSLRISLPSLDIHSQILTTISRFQAENPDVSLSFEDLELDTIEDALANHNLDLAITYSFITDKMNLSSYNYTTCNLFHESMCAVVNLHSPESKMDALDLYATKLEHPLLLANADNHFMEQRIPSSLFSEHRNPHHVKPISLNSIILSVINNTGWACLPECVANRFSGICKILPFKGINTSHYVTMCWRTEPANYMLNKLAEMICQEFHKK